MNDPKIDDERLAALLDGRLGDAERRELLAQLSTAGEDYEVFTDSAAVLRELEEEEAGAVDAQAEAPAPALSPSLPPSVRTRGWRRSGRWAALPAGVVALALAFLLLPRARASGANDPVQLAMRLEQSGRGLPAEWPGAERWGAIRGGDASPPATPEERNARAVRAGALLVDLAVAARSGDTDTTRLLATQAAARFEPGSGRSTPLHQIANRPDAPYDSLAPLLQRATDRLANRFGRPYLQLGAWTEAALLAAHRRDVAFFRADESRTILRSARDLTQGDARAALDRVRAAADAEAPDWNALEKALNTLQLELATVRPFRG